MCICFSDYLLQNLTVGLGKSKNQDKKAIEEAIRLCKVWDILKQCVEDIENSIIDGSTDSDLAAMVDAERHLADACMSFRHAETKVKVKENGLEVDDRMELRKLTQNIFITT
jgi:hypothetical protein